MKEQRSKTGKMMKLAAGCLLLLALMIVNVQVSLNAGSPGGPGLTEMNEECVTEAGFFSLSTAIFTPLAVATCAYGECGQCAPGSVCDPGGAGCCLRVCDGSCTDCFSSDCNGSSIECGSMSNGTTCYRDAW